MNPLRGGWLIGLTLLGSATLAVAQLPDGSPAWLAALRPDWVTLALYFWLIERPQRIGMVSVWAFGLLLDVLHGGALGVNGLCLVGLTLLGWAWYERLRMHTMLQQAIVLLVLALILAVVRGLASLWAQGTPPSFFWGTSAATTALLWPVIRSMLRPAARLVQ